MARDMARETTEQRGSGSEAGWTLVELLVVIAILSVVLTAVLSVFDTANQTAARDQERATAMNEDLAGFNRIVSDLSQAYKVNYPTGSATSSNVFDFDIRETVGGTAQQDRRVAYVCTSAGLVTAYHKCVRYDDAANDSSWAIPTSDAGENPPITLAAVVVLPRVVNGSTVDPGDPIFNSLSSPDGSTGRPDYGNVTVKTPGTGSRQPDTTTHWQVFQGSFQARQLAYAH